MSFCGTQRECIISDKKSETITSLPWTKTQEVMTPFNATMRISYVVKDDVIYDKESYHVGRTYNVSAVESAGGGILGSKGQSDSHSVGQDRIAEYLQDLVANLDEAALSSGSADN